MDSTLGIVGLVCYLGGVCYFHNQLQTSLTGNQTALQRAKAAMAKAKAGFSPAFSGAIAA